jgi:hypothetical protein
MMSCDVFVTQGSLAGSSFHGVLIFIDQCSNNARKAAVDFVKSKLRREEKMFRRVSHPVSSITKIIV